MAKNRADTGQWIGTRRFTANVKGKRKFATAKIGRPVKSGADWACRIFVSNVGMKEPIRVYGLDQMQVIILALEGVLTTLRNCGVEWRWVHGEKDDLGIPRFVPGGFGRGFAARLESIIDAETAKFAAKAEQRHNRNVGRRRKSDFDQGCEQNVLDITMSGSTTSKRILRACGIYIAAVIVATVVIGFFRQTLLGATATKYLLAGRRPRCSKPLRCGELV